MARCRAPTYICNRPLQTCLLRPCFEIRFGVQNGWSPQAQYKIQPKADGPCSSLIGWWGPRCFVSKTRVSPHRQDIMLRDDEDPEQIRIKNRQPSALFYAAVDDVLFPFTNTARHIGAVQLSRRLKSVHCGGLNDKATTFHWPRLSTTSKTSVHLSRIQKT